MGEKDKNNASMEEDIDKFFDNMNQLGGNIFSITRKLLSMTSDSLSEFNDIAKTKSHNWLFDDERDRRDDERGRIRDDDAEAYHDFKNGIKSMIADIQPKIDEFVNKPYEDRTGVRSECKDEERHRGWGKDHPWACQSHPFRDYWKGGFKNGQTPFGYYTYGTPSIRAYNDCMRKDGEMLYDSKGYWRCLFPNLEVPNKLLASKRPGEILTKEDFQNARLDNRSSEEGVDDLGDRGTYFKTFDLYMNWQNTMYENVRRDRKERREKILAKRKQRLEDFKQRSIVEPEPQPKHIVSASVQSTYSSDSDRNEIVLKEIKTEYFNDGTSVTKNITKTKPFEAKDWTNVIENVDTGKSENAQPNLLTNDLFDQESDKNGWFWNKKK